MRDAQDILKIILDPSGSGAHDEEFPNAPPGWTRAQATELAAQENLDLGDDHWEAIRVLQACYADEEEPPTRRISDALEARFKNKGERKYLFQLFPGGPLAQGCRLAGLQSPSGSVDESFGSVR